LKSKMTKKTIRSLDRAQATEVIDAVVESEMSIESGTSEQAEENEQAREVNKSKRLVLKSRKGKKAQSEKVSEEEAEKSGEPENEPGETENSKDPETSKEPEGGAVEETEALLPAFKEPKPLKSRKPKSTTCSPDRNQAQTQATEVIEAPIEQDKSKESMASEQTSEVNKSKRLVLKSSKGKKAQSEKVSEEAVEKSVEHEVDKSASSEKSVHDASRKDKPQKSAVQTDKNLNEKASGLTREAKASKKAADTFGEHDQTGLTEIQKPAKAKKKLALRKPSARAISTPNRTVVMRQNLTFADQSIDVSAISVLSPKTPVQSAQKRASARKAPQQQEESFQFLHRKKDAFDDLEGKRSAPEREKRASRRDVFLDESAAPKRKRKDSASAAEKGGPSRKAQKENSMSRENSPIPPPAEKKNRRAANQSKRKREPSPVAESLSPHGRPIRKRTKNTKYL